MSVVLQFGVTPKTKPLPAGRSALIGALDVGTSKIACLIGKLRPHAPQHVLRRLPIGYSLDKTRDIRDPRGMIGKEFGVDMHMMSADIAVARNLMLAIESCHLEIGAMAASPYAAALSVLADDEADLGAALID